MAYYWSSLFHQYQHLYLGETLLKWYIDWIALEKVILDDRSIFVISVKRDRTLDPMGAQEYSF